MFFEQRNWNRLRAQEIDHRFVNRKSGVGINHFVTGLDQSEHREKDDGLASRNNRDVSGCYLNRACAADVGGYRLTQFQKAGRGTIMSPALVQRLFAGVDDMPRRVKIGFAHFEMKDVV